jgi:hypothetical protein
VTSGGSGGGSGTTASDASASGSPSGGQISGSWTTAQITCAGSTNAYLTALFSSPNSQTYTFSSENVVVQSMLPGCTLTDLLDLTYTGANAFSISQPGTLQCSPAACNSSCGAPGGVTVSYTYDQSGNMLTLTSTDSGICDTLGQPTVITLTQ